MWSWPVQLWAASCLVDLVRPCWFSRSGEVPDGDVQGKETLICCRTRCLGLPLKEHRKSSYSATKLNSVFADDLNTPLSHYWGEDFTEASAPLHLLMQDHLHFAVPSSSESGGRGWTTASGYQDFHQKPSCIWGYSPMESYCIFFLREWYFMSFHFGVSSTLWFFWFTWSPQKTRCECSRESYRAGQVWGLSRVLDQVRYQERSLDVIVSGGFLWLMQIYFQLLNFSWFLWIIRMRWLLKNLLG